MLCQWSTQSPHSTNTIKFAELVLAVRSESQIFFVLKTTLKLQPTFKTYHFYFYLTFSIQNIIKCLLHILCSQSDVLTRL